MARAAHMMQGRSHLAPLGETLGQGQEYKNLEYDATIPKIYLPSEYAH